MFRKVNLPDCIQGSLYLHSMLGRRELLADATKEIKDLGIDRVVCLTSMDEIRQKSPEYCYALVSSNYDWQQSSFHILDFSAPDDKEAFMSFIRDIAEKVKAGEKILIHCGAGIGRTGMAAVAVLIALGFNLDQAEKMVTNAGSGPEVNAQKEFLLGS